MTVQEAIKYWKVFLKEIAFLKRQHSSVDWEEQERATKMAIEALEKQSKLERVIERLEELTEKYMSNSEKAAELGIDYEKHMIYNGAKGNALEETIEIIKKEMM